jgi:transposase InsO family protein
MPWQERSTMSLRHEFVQLANQPGTNFSELCARFGISRKTGYKWQQRYRENGLAGLHEHSRRPQRSPFRSKASIEQGVLAVRDQYGWGARKIKACLKRTKRTTVARSTVHAILLRHGRVAPQLPQAHGAFQRFEQERPNQLWQMDFKGHYRLGNSERCHPLTVLDDHSRYSLCLQACRNEQTGTVQQQLTATFRRYGLPERMLMDNGSPWGGAVDHGYTPLTVWLLRLGVAISHSRPFHPQTQGKDERFHRSLKVEVLAQRLYADFTCMQLRFDDWRYCYNHVRPHEALDMAVPASRYQPSPRSFPEQLPAFEYDLGDQVRKVQTTGKISFAGRHFRVGRPFQGYPVALRPTTSDGLYEVFFATHKIGTIDLQQPCE